MQIVDKVLGCPTYLHEVKPVGRHLEQFPFHKFSQDKIQGLRISSPFFMQITSVGSGNVVQLCSIAVPSCSSAHLYTAFCTRNLRIKK